MKIPKGTFESLDILGNAKKKQQKFCIQHFGYAEAEKNDLKQCAIQKRQRATEK